jgi:Kef-type K+ transport system membrane component KefB
LSTHRTPVVTILFLPAFFALTGLRTEIGLVSSWQDWGMCLLIVALATAGKFGGTVAAGRLMKMPGRFAAQLGILMNTRGLMELVVLNVGLDLGVISPTLFTMMVIMALVTTAMTAPLLDWAGAPGASVRPERGED